MKLYLRDNMNYFLGYIKSDEEKVLYSAKVGDLNGLMLCINRGIDIDTADNNDRTLLYLASKHGHFEIAKYLVEKDASIDKADKDGWTPLHIAVFTNQLLLVEFLLRNDASINATTKTGKTTLQIAQENNFLAIMQMIINHIPQDNTCLQEQSASQNTIIDKKQEKIASHETANDINKQIEKQVDEFEEISRDAPSSRIAYERIKIGDMWSEGVDGIIDLKKAELYYKDACFIAACKGDYIAQQEAIQKLMLIK